jgi:Na+/H+ antiporter NhaD/arsenite permease-like protein
MLPSRNVLKLVNWQLLVLFIGLFVVVGAFVDSGLSQKMLAVLTNHGINVNNPVELAVISGVLSNCINNSATVMLLVKVVNLTNPMNCYALALSNAFAGNLIIVGSLANIIVVQCAENLKLKISFVEFFKYGAPTAIASMLILIGWLCIF